MGLEAEAPIIYWVKVITKFSTRLETASFVLVHTTMLVQERR